MQITVIRKSDNSVITRIFEDEEGIKEITDDDYEVLIEKTRINESLFIQIVEEWQKIMKNMNQQKYYPRIGKN